jgi:hypothetical protein
MAQITKHKDELQTELDEAKDYIELDDITGIAANEDEDDGEDDEDEN